MNRIITIGLLLFALSANAQYTERDIYNYIDQFKGLAMEEQARSGVPASITLAQGILESGAGTSELSMNANNHFGIKCKSYWTGLTYYKKDEVDDECFRKYENYESSYRDHSEFLKTGTRYSSLFNLDLADYQSWARGLQKAGYATSKTYADRLIDLIERYNLNQFATGLYANSIKENTYKKEPIFSENNQRDEQEEISTNNTSITINNEDIATGEYYKLTRLHGIPGFYARKGDMLLEQAIKNKVRYAKLLALNDLEDEPLPYDMFIYLDTKKSHGERPNVVVGNDDNLHKISQREGISLETLRTLNHLSIGEEPSVGATLQLQNIASEKPNTFANGIPSNSSVSGTVKQEETTNKNEVNYIDKSEITKESIPVSPMTMPNEERNIPEVSPTPQEIELILSDDIEVINNQPIATGVRPMQTIDKKEIEQNKNEPKVVEQPKSETELDALKKRFDRSVYVGTSAPEKKKSENLMEVTQQNVEENVIEEVQINNPEASDPNERLKEHMRKVRTDNEAKNNKE